MKHEVEYVFDIISKPKVVKTEGCNSIWFKNIAEDTGDVLADTATIDDTVPLRAGDAAEKYDNPDPEAVIKKSFHIKFDGAGTDKRILVTRVYKHPIK